MLKDSRGTSPKDLRSCSPTLAVRPMISPSRSLWRPIKTRASVRSNAATTVRLGCAITSAISLRRELSTQSKPNSTSSSSLPKARLKLCSKTQASSLLSCKPFRELVEMYKFHINGCTPSETMLTSWFATKFRLVLDVRGILSGHGRSQVLCLILSHAVSRLRTVTQWAHVFSNSSLSVSCPVHTSTLLEGTRLHVWLRMQYCQSWKRTV